MRKFYKPPVSRLASAGAILSNETSDSFHLDSNSISNSESDLHSSLGSNSDSRNSDAQNSDARNSKTRISQNTVLRGSASKKPFLRSVKSWSDPTHSANCNDLPSTHFNGRITSFVFDPIPEEGQTVQNVSRGIQNLDTGQKLPEKVKKLAEKVKNDDLVDNSIRNSLNPLDTCQKTINYDFAFDFNENQGHERPKNVKNIGSEGFKASEDKTTPDPDPPYRRKSQTGDGGSTGKSGVVTVASSGAKLAQVKRGEPPRPHKPLTRTIAVNNIENKDGIARLKNSSSLSQDSDYITQYTETQHHSCSQTQNLKNSWDSQNSQNSHNPNSSRNPQNSKNSKNNHASDDSDSLPDSVLALSETSGKKSSNSSIVEPKTRIGQITGKLGRCGSVVRSVQLSKPNQKIEILIKRVPKRTAKNEDFSILDDSTENNSVENNSIDDESSGLQERLGIGLQHRTESSENSVFDGDVSSRPHQVSSDSLSPDENEEEEEITASFHKFDRKHTKKVPEPDPNRFENRSRSLLETLQKLKYDTQKGRPPGYPPNETLRMSKSYEIECQIRISSRKNHSQLSQNRDAPPGDVPGKSHFLPTCNDDVQLHNEEQKLIHDLRSYASSSSATLSFLSDTDNDNGFHSDNGMVTRTLQKPKGGCHTFFTSSENNDSDTYHSKPGRVALLKPKKSKIRSTSYDATGRRGGGGGKGGVSGIIINNGGLESLRTKKIEKSKNTGRLKNLGENLGFAKLEAKLGTRTSSRLSSRLSSQISDGGMVMMSSTQKVRLSGIHKNGGGTSDFGFDNGLYSQSHAYSQSTSNVYNRYSVNSFDRSYDSKISSSNEPNGLMHMVMGLTNITRKSSLQDYWKEDIPHDVKMTEIDNLLGKYCKRKSTFCAGDLIVRVLKQPTGRKNEAANEKLPKTSSHHHSNLKNSEKCVARRFQSLPSLGNEAGDKVGNLHSALDKTISGPVSNHHRHHGNYPENHERFRERDKHESLSTNTYDNGDGVAYYGASTSNSKGNSNTSSSNNNENNNVTLNTTVHSAFEKSRFQTESVPYQFDPGSNRDRSTAVGH